MDEYLSEREQVDRIRLWWKQNGAYIIVGIGGGLLALAGWNWWQGYQLTRAEQASAIYSVLAEAAMDQRVDDVRIGVDRLAAAHGGSIYLQHGRLALAASLVRTGDPAAAIAELERVVNDTKDPQLKQVARLRLARLLASEGEHDRALQVTRTASDSVFAAALHEVEGDVLAARGETAAAREAYRKALDSGGATGVIDEDFVQLKLEALGGGAGGDIS